MVNSLKFAPVSGERSSIRDTPMFIGVEHPARDVAPFPPLQLTALSSSESRNCVRRVFLAPKLLNASHGTAVAAAAKRHGGALGPMFVA